MLSRRIAAIENCNLGLFEKVELVLIGENQKPATIVYISQSGFYDPEKGYYPLDESVVRDTQDMLRFVGLDFELGEREIFPHNHFVITRDGIMKLPPVERIPIYVAANQKNLQRIVTATEYRDERLLGECYGFPDTAIQAYLGERDRFYGSLRDGSARGFFTQFVFSADFFREEFRSTSLRWHETIREKSPRLYGDIIEDEKLPVFEFQLPSQ